MLKRLTISTLLIWMTVSQVVMGQGNRSSFEKIEDVNGVQLLSSSNRKLNNDPTVKDPNEPEKISSNHASLKSMPEMIRINMGKNGRDEFLIARTEVTVRQFKLFCEETGRSMPSRMPNWGWNENHPIVYVTWKDANEYCMWLSDKTGLKYRLPTVQEWETAAKGGAKSLGYTYSGYDDPRMVSWYWGDEEEVNSTQTVATKKPNEIGLYDMSGNAWEWCSNPQDKDGNINTRYLKGGSWNRHKSTLKIDYTEEVPANYFNFDLGFRPVAEL
ncbi:MAG: hypothetical protein CMO01_26845 [Thalassobius sp.]|nr:hypothetical protein [Thalassovita sp.]